MQTQNLKEVFTPFALFNPKVITVSPDSELGEEGCLSFPNMFLMVKRPEHVIVEFLDRNNNKHIIRLDGIDARCFLHELDHLNGVCFTEHVSKLKLQMAIKKQRKLNGRTKR
jgi:peptide deformylase